MDFSALVSYDLLPWQWAAWILTGLCIGLTKTGFSGLTSVTIPVMAVIFGARASTGLMLPVLIFADILAVAYYRKHAEWKYILKLVPWSLAGLAAAILVERLIPVQAFRYIMGASIVAGLIVMLWTDLRGKNRLPPSKWWFSALFGIAGGFATTFGNAAGPILAVFLLSMRLPKNSFVGTTAWFFLIINVMKLPIQIFLWENISAGTLLFNLTLIPFVVTGAALGVFLIKKIPENAYRKIIMALTLLSTLFLFI
ncbi:MAG: sulfite exporter TauE/SafE family protein [Spirochaetes bacterium]|nr:sulfite exporter TauE/SafE family protein [Spirochaetota bacterium]